MNRPHRVPRHARASALRFAYAFWLLCYITAAAAGAAAVGTNALPRWLPLAEVLKKWEGTPLEGVQRAAEGGDLTAQHYLGYCFTEAFRFPQNVPSGLTWYERAGKAGYLPSWNNMGLVYRRGTGVPRDVAKSTQCFRLAAEGGMAQAQTSLGYLYRDGDGVPRDPVEAMRWFRRAADQGHVPAMVEIGRLYRFGQ